MPQVAEGCGTTFLIVGILLSAFGYFWHFPAVTATTGVIVESTVPSYGGRGTVRLLTYAYTAYGLHHRGQRVLRYPPQYEGTYDVGRSFPVYFVSDHPESSCAPNRPRSTSLIAVGVLLSVASAGVIFFAWPR